MEEILELTLNIPVDDLMVLCETIMDFKNLKDNDFDFSKTLELQGRKGLFERLIGHVYPVLVKQLWIHDVATNDTISSFVMKKKIVVTEKPIDDLISHNSCGKRVYNIKIDARR